MSQRITDLTLSVLASVVAFGLSWPFWRDFEYWPESHVAWWIYFVLGFVLSVYVFYVFTGSLRILLLHGKEEAAAAANSDSSDNTGERS
jgi:drug/metabolite transporter (DMT)-like permease